MDFTDKRVLVTGGSRGIGFSVANAFIDTGAHIAINGRTDDSVAAAVAALGEGDCRVAAQQAPALRPLRVDDYFALKNVGGPRVSPDGAWVAYTVRARTWRTCTRSATD